MRTSDAYCNTLYGYRAAVRGFRLHRNLSRIGTALAFIGASASAAQAAQLLPAWVSMAGGFLLVLMAAMGYALRPLETALRFEQDAKRYGALLARADGMSEPDLDAALAALGDDQPEVEALRMLAYNDTLEETGAPPEPLPLRTRMLAVLA